MKITPNNILKGIRYLKNYGWKEFGIRLREKSEPEEISYMDWYRKHCATAQQLEEQRKQAARWKNSPLISVLVPAYKTPERFLCEMIASVQAQSYENWELCIADAGAESCNDHEDRSDCKISANEESDAVRKIVEEYQKEDKRIRYRQLPENLGIAGNTNAALEMAQGSYIALLDHDDVLAPDALYEVAKVIVDDTKIVQSGVHWDTYAQKWAQAVGAELTEQGVPELIYSDEDKVTQDLSEHYAPHFKPDFNPDLLRSNNYITHLTVVKTELARQVGGFDSAFDGAQDYDFILRCTQQAKRIVHIPKVLYHWRMHEASTAANQSSKTYAFDAGERAIQAHLNRTGVQGTVMRFEEPERAGFYWVKYDRDTNPLVSVIIPNKDEIKSLEQCLESVFRSSYQNYEIIIVENNSSQPETFAYYEKITKQNSNIRVVTWELQSGFNYSAINNYGVGFANGEYLVFLNNDVEILTEDWLEELLGHCMRPEVAIAGARLYYPDDSIQHAGIVVGVGGHVRGVATNMLVGTRRIHDGYLHKAAIQSDYSAVTAACMMMKKSVFDEVEGFTEQLSVAFNDVDLCLKARKAGYLVVYDPFVEAYHYESKSRGQEDSPEKIRRFQTEIEYMRTEWNDILRYGDPYYNPNFSRVKCNYSLNGLD